MRFTILAEQQNSVVAVFARHTGAADAIEQLEKSGFDARQLSVLGRDFYDEEHAFGLYTTGERIKYWGSLADFWDAVWGLQAGAAFLIVPGIGPVLIAGRIASWIIGAMEAASGVGGITPIGSGLVSLGMPKSGALYYENSVKLGKFLLIAHGTPDDLGNALAILKASSAEQVNLHLLSAESPSAGVYAA